MRTCPFCGKKEAHLFCCWDCWEKYDIGEKTSEMNRKYKNRDLANEKLIECVLNIIRKEKLERI
jgi:uncharacterized membrane protein YvbJ